MIPEHLVVLFRHLRKQFNTGLIHIVPILPWILFTLVVACSSKPQVPFENLLSYNTFEKLKTQYGAEAVTWVDHPADNYHQARRDVHLFAGTDREVEFVMLNDEYLDYAVAKEGSTWTTLKGFRPGLTLAEVGEIAEQIVSVSAEGYEVTLPDGSLAAFSGLDGIRRDGKQNALSNEEPYNDEIKIQVLRISMNRPDRPTNYTAPTTASKPEESKEKMYDSVFLATVNRVTLPWNVEVKESDAFNEVMVVDSTKELFLLISPEEDDYGGTKLVLRVLSPKGDVITKNDTLFVERQPSEFSDLKAKSEEGAGRDCENSWPNPSFTSTLSIDADLKINLSIAYEFSGCGEGSSATRTFDGRIENSSLTGVVYESQKVEAVP